MNDSTPAPANTGSFWAWVPALLLGSMLVGLGTLAYIAIDDPGFALEPNYYDKAVHWDQSQAAGRESDALGLELALAPLTVVKGGQVQLELTVNARGGSPFTGGDVRVEAFPNAFASRIERVALRETAPGVYSGGLPRGVLGLWELRVTLKRGALNFQQILRRDVAKGHSA
jgi:hypothetical protein